MQETQSITNVAFPRSVGTDNYRKRPKVELGILEALKIFENDLCDQDLVPNFAKLFDLLNNIAFVKVKAPNIVVNH